LADPGAVASGRSHRPSDHQVRLHELPPLAGRFSAFVKLSPGLVNLPVPADRLTGGARASLLFLDPHGFAKSNVFNGLAEVPFQLLRGLGVYSHGQVDAQL